VLIQPVEVRGPDEPSQGCARRARVRPAGIRAAATRVVDRATCVILTALAEGSEDGRRAIPEFLRFLAQLPGWVAGPPVIEPLNGVGAYRLFGPQREEFAGREGGRAGHGPRDRPSRPDGGAWGDVRPSGGAMDTRGARRLDVPVPPARHRGGAAPRHGSHGGGADRRSGEPSLRCSGDHWTGGRAALRVCGAFPTCKATRRMPS